MSAVLDERAEALALLAELKRARDNLAEKRKALALQCLDRRAEPEDKRALAAVDAKLAQIKAQIDEVRGLLGSGDDFESHVISPPPIATAEPLKETPVTTLPHPGTEEETDDQE